MCLGLKPLGRSFSCSNSFHSQLHTYGDTPILEQNLVGCICLRMAGLRHKKSSSASSENCCAVKHIVMIQAMQVTFFVMTWCHTPTVSAWRKSNCWFNYQFHCTCSRSMRLYNARYHKPNGLLQSILFCVSQIRGKNRLQMRRVDWVLILAPSPRLRKRGNRFQIIIAWLSIRKKGIQKVAKYSLFKENLLIQAKRNRKTWKNMLCVAICNEKTPC